MPAPQFSLPLSGVPLALHAAPVAGEELGSAVDLDVEGPLQGPTLLGNSKPRSILQGRPFCSTLRHSLPVFCLLCAHPSARAATVQEVWTVSDFISFPGKSGQQGDSGLGSKQADSSGYVCVC